MSGIIPFEDWEHLVDLLLIIEEHRLVIILKARQLGITWLMAGYSLWKALFHEGANIIMLSKGESEASEMLDYARFLHSQLPAFLRIGKGKDQASLISFPSSYSRIRALPATQDAGLGFGGATLLVLDEWEFHDYASQNYDQIKPMIDAGGQLVILSAVNGETADSKFKEIYNKAKLGENNFFNIFLDYNPHNSLPYRNEEWYERQVQDYGKEAVERLYPRTEAEALAPLKTTCRFDVTALDGMLDECQPPLREEYNGWVKIYKEPIPGRHYCFPIDPSEGSYDPSLGVIIDADKDEEVAKFHGKIPLDEQARIAFDLYERYNKPYTAPERNASGLALINMLVDMGVRNWYYCDKQKQKPGWWTSSSNRGVMIQDEAEMIRLRQHKIYDEQEIGEFKSFIRTDKHPDGKARGGCHDEAPIVWSIYSQVRKSMPRGEMRVASWKYR